MRVQIASASTRVARWRGQLLDLLFPTRCVSCQRPGESFCARCRSQIRFVTPPFCNRCNHPLRTPGDACPQCRRYPLRITQLRAVAYHEGELRAAIHAYKYQRRTDLAIPLAALLHQYVQDAPLPIDVVAAVPLAAERLRQRGYNQAELLARELASHLSLPYRSGLDRIRATADQVGLDARARRANVQAAFTAAPSAWQGRRVLLVDDVCTTGATLDECAGALLAQGATSVYGLAVARPRHPYNGLPPTT